jgi:hypothetical protein
MALSWLNLPRALKPAIARVSRHWATLASLPRQKGRSKALGPSRGGAPTHGPNGGVADTLDEPKVAFRAGVGALG